MPVYEYRCRSCGHQFDVQQSFTDDALTVCPECGGELRKVFAPVGISFKGSGFYKTDSRSGSSTAPSTTGSSSEGGAGASSGSNGSNTSTGSTGSTGSGGGSGGATPSTSGGTGD